MQNKSAGVHATPKEFKQLMSKTEARLAREQYPQSGDQIVALQKRVESLEKEVEKLRKKVTGQDTRLNNLADRVIVGEFRRGG